MNKFHKLLFASAALAADAAVQVPLAIAQDSPTNRPFTRAGMIGGMVGGAPLISIALKHKAELNLSNDQVANLEKIRSHYQSQVTPIQQQLVAAEKEIAGLTQQTPANLVQIKTKIQETEKVRSELRYLRIEALENGRSVLNAQQQEQLNTLARAGHEHLRKSQGQPS